MDKAQKIMSIFISLYIYTISVGCNTWHSYHKERIVYYVFDSLENYLAEDFRLKGYDNKHIAIYMEVARTDFGANRNWVITDHYLSPDVFNLGILNMASRDSFLFANIVRRSNRVMFIGGRYYPLYLYPYDDIFESKSNYSSIYGKMPHLSPEHSITIDMGKKTFYVEEGVERGLP